MPGSKRVVLQHLERISWRVMDTHPRVVREMIRGRSGIYALYRGEKLYYIGRASNLMRRLKQHLKDRHRGSWDRFSVYLTVRDEHMKELESLVLRIINPVGNAVTGKFIDSENLRSELRRRMKQIDADRRESLMGHKVAKARVRTRAKRRKGGDALAGVFDKRTPLRGWRSGKEHKAMLRTDGTIRYAGKIYKSPSGAGHAAVRGSCNGWRFWHFKDSKGEWVQLRALRQ